MHRDGFIPIYDRPARSARPASQYAVAVLGAVLVQGLVLYSALRKPAPDPVVQVMQPAGISLDLSGWSDQAGETGEEAAKPSLFEQIQQSDATTPTPPEARAISSVSLAALFDGAPAKGAPSPSATAPSRGAAGARGLPAGMLRVGDPGAQISMRSKGLVGPDGQVAPCWTKPAARLAVRMIIVLDHDGSLLGRPYIDRGGRSTRGLPAGAAAETLAMQSMAGCSPFVLPSRAGRYRSFELDFSRGADWIRPAGLVDVR